MSLRARSGSALRSMASQPYCSIDGYPDGGQACASELVANGNRVMLERPVPSLPSQSAGRQKVPRSAFQASISGFYGREMGHPSGRRHHASSVRPDTSVHFSHQFMAHTRQNVTVKVDGDVGACAGSAEHGFAWYSLTRKGVLVKPTRQA